MANAPEFTMPKVDFAAVVELQKKNFDALSEASQIIGSGLKAVLQRQSELTQAAMQEYVTATETAFKGDKKDFNPEAAMADVKARYESALASSKELIDMAVKAHSEAIEVLGKRAVANFDEIKSMAA